ncbi:MAG: Tfx family DNA-binding protein [Methanofollis sp.]|nr:Tfx family DNA-binding protein [Methanofollis sp.]
MKQGLLTDRQKEVLRYRKMGLTQQQVADIIQTSKANVCTVEKAAYENIDRARDTLEFLYTLDSDHLCTVKAGTDLIEAASAIFLEAEKLGIKVKYNTIELVNRVQESNPGKFRARYVREDVEVYINQEGDLFFS